MPTTLGDIARALNVSKMTVSRAINNHPEINPETRARVLAAARKMNYRPNQFARALTSKHSYLIGIVVPGLPTTVFFIVAAWCFSKSSPRFEQWVLDRPGIGPMVRDYRSGLGMPRSAKTAAISSIAVVCSLSAFLATSGWILRTIILAAGAVGVVWILWRVPTRPDGNSNRELPREARWFRFAAIAEAVTWLGLLVGMAVKHIGSGSETGVQIFGMIHGVVVLVYFVVTLFAAKRLLQPEGLADGVAPRSAAL